MFHLLLDDCLENDPVLTYLQHVHWLLKKERKGPLLVKGNEKDGLQNWVQLATIINMDVTSNTQHDSLEFFETLMGYINDKLICLDR